MSPGALGEKFVDFELDGFSSEEARKDGPLALLFWRTGCSTSRLTIPYWQRLADRYPQANVVAICQDEIQTTAEWCRDNGITMDQLIDSPGQAVTRRFGVTIVPAYWIVDSSGRILMKGSGWERAKIEQVNEVLAMKLGLPPEPLVTEAEVPAYKPG